MECTDLMLDDWVLDTYTGKPMRVQVVNIKVGKGLDPIPITPEILEKNGFHKTSHSWIIRDGFMGITFQFFKGKWSFSCRNEIQKKDEMGRADLVSINRDWCSVIYAHELQHALLLCGIDKEIIV